MPITIRSRIHEYFSHSVLKKLDYICNDRTIPDNNTKVDLILQVMNESGIDYIELGPGTNRLAILIDNYVFKIAMDKWGKRDNLNEFTLTKELQPYVIRTYETNELLSVCEYITVISKEEFVENKEQIRAVLGILADSYLLGDVGSVNKNFTNWGYRDNGDLVILDFAYIYRIHGDEILCTTDQTILNYDENFHNLICPTCRQKFEFSDIRRLVTPEQEAYENNIAKQFAYMLTEPVQEFDKSYLDGDDESVEESESTENNIPNEEDNKMTKDYDEFEEEIMDEDENGEDSYLRLLDAMKQEKEVKEIIEEGNLDINNEKINVPDEGVVIVKTDRTTVESEIKIYGKDNDGDIDVVKIPIENSVIESKYEEPVNFDLTLEISAGMAEAVREADERMMEELGIDITTSNRDETVEVILTGTSVDSPFPIENGKIVGPVDDDAVMQVVDGIALDLLPPNADKTVICSVNDTSFIQDLDAKALEILHSEEETDLPDNIEEALENIVDGIKEIDPIIQIRDIDNDGEDEIIIKSSKRNTEVIEKPLDEVSEDHESEEELTFAEIMERHDQQLRNSQPSPEEEIIIINTDKAVDSIVIDIKLTPPGTTHGSAEDLRRELAGDISTEDVPLIIDEDRVQDLAEVYIESDE